MFQRYSISGLLLAAAVTLGACSGGSSEPVVSANAQLANTIRSDARLPTVRAKAKQLAAREMTAGSVYPEVWIRDLNTFVEIAIEAQGAVPVRAKLLQFLAHQAADGGIVDGIAMHDGSPFKNTVESDQESSLVQAVAKYVAITGDKALLNELIDGQSVITRLERAVLFLYTQRFSAQHGLVYGATRADWGDVQPEDSPGIDMNDNSHPSISIYDNAMLMLALTSLRDLELAAGRDPAPWAERGQALRAAVRTHLWTGTQFIPHIYMDKGSPFPAGFDESRMYFQGGTAVAIQAGLLEPAEVQQAFSRMVQNKIDSNSGSVGVSLYPPYPAGYFANKDYMAVEYVYQNGGDWPWFGARIIQQMIAHDQVQQAYQELSPMLDRVTRDNGFYEWYTREGAPRGAREYRGTAGQLVIAIDMLQQWASKH